MIKDIGGLEWGYPVVIFKNVSNSKMTRIVSKRRKAGDKQRDRGNGEKQRNDKNQNPRGNSTLRSCRKRAGRTPTLAVGRPAQWLNLRPGCGGYGDGHGWSTKATRFLW